MNFAKVGIYLAIIVVCFAAGKWTYNAIYGAGFNAAVVQQEALIREAKDEAVAKARQEWENTATIANDNIVIEERIVEVERIVEKEIPKIVERIVERTPECNDLGPDFVGLLNAQVNSGASRSNGGADVTAESHP